MTIETWKAEFYPSRAKDFKSNENPKPSDVVLHSLNKWIGMKKANLKKHGLHFSIAKMSIIETITGQICITVDDSSCSLCKIYHNLLADISCINCPLYKSNGNMACYSHKRMKRGEQKIIRRSDYHAMTESGNPNPMIRSLQRAYKDALEKETQV